MKYAFSSFSAVGVDCAFERFAFAIAYICADKVQEMSRKIFFSTTLVLMVALLVNGTAFAASNTITRYQVSYVGRIISTKRAGFTIQTVDDHQYIVKVSQATKYQRVSGGTSSFRNMNVGRWVTVIGIPGHKNIVNATTIVTMPVHVTKSHWSDRRAYGTVFQVIPGRNLFTLMTKNGLMNFTVGNSTHFTGNSVRHFLALKAGMHAVVGYSLERDGSHLALGVAAY
jgi:hypothetical protein